MVLSEDSTQGHAHHLEQMILAMERTEGYNEDALDHSLHPEALYKFYREDEENSQMEEADDVEIIDHLSDDLDTEVDKNVDENEELDEDDDNDSQILITLQMQKDAALSGETAAFIGTRRIPSSATQLSKKHASETSSLDSRNTKTLYQGKVASKKPPQLQRNHHQCRDW